MRLSARMKGKIQATGRLLKRNIDVVQDLNVITKKADWLNHNSVIAVMLQTRQRVFDRGNTPGCIRRHAPRRAQKDTPRCIANVTAFVAGAFVGRLKRTGKSASTK